MLQAPQALQNGGGGGLKGDYRGYIGLYRGYIGIILGLYSFRIYGIGGEPLIMSAARPTWCLIGPWFCWLGTVMPRKTSQV